MMDEMSASPLNTPAIVVMGVSASGKSTIAEGLAGRLGVEWVDADDLHPPANVVKMTSGVPLEDADRWPWLDAVGARLARGRDAGGIVIACSALKRAYRDRLREVCPQTVFIHLSGSQELLASRIAGRTDHFMPSTLLQSQFDTLDPLAADERGVAINVAASPEEIVDDAIAWVAGAGAGAY